MFKFCQWFAYLDRKMNIFVIFVTCFVLVYGFPPMKRASKQDDNGQDEDDDERCAVILDTMKKVLNQSGIISFNMHKFNAKPSENWIRLAKKIIRSGRSYSMHDLKESDVDEISRYSKKMSNVFTPMKIHLLEATISGPELFSMGGDPQWKLLAGKKTINVGYDTEHVDEPMPILSSKKNDISFEFELGPKFSQAERVHITGLQNPALSDPTLDLLMDGRDQKIKYSLFIHDGVGFQNQRMSSSDNAEITKGIQLARGIAEHLIKGIQNTVPEKELGVDYEYESESNFISLRDADAVNYIRAWIHPKSNKLANVDLYGFAKRALGSPQILSMFKKLKDINIREPRASGAGQSIADYKFNGVPKSQQDRFVSGIVDANLRKIQKKVGAQGVDENKLNDLENWMSNAIGKDFDSYRKMNKVDRKFVPGKKYFSGHIDSKFKPLRMRVEAPYGVDMPPTIDENCHNKSPAEDKLSEDTSKTESDTDDFSDSQETPTDKYARRYTTEIILTEPRASYPPDEEDLKKSENDFPHFIDSPNSEEVPSDEDVICHTTEIILTEPEAPESRKKFLPEPGDYSDSEDAPSDDDATRHTTETILTEPEAPESRKNFLPEPGDYSDSEEAPSDEDSTCHTTEILVTEPEAPQSRKKNLPEPGDYSDSEDAPSDEDTTRHTTETILTEPEAPESRKKFLPEPSDYSDSEEVPSDEETTCYTTEIILTEPEAPQSRKKYLPEPGDYSDSEDAPSDEDATRHTTETILTEPEAPKSRKKFLPEPSDYSDSEEAPSDEDTTCYTTEIILTEPEAPQSRKKHLPEPGDYSDSEDAPSDEDATRHTTETILTEPEAPESHKNNNLPDAEETQTDEDVTYTTDVILTKPTHDYSEESDGSNDDYPNDSKCKQ